MTRAPWKSDRREINWDDKKAVEALLAVAFGEGYYTITADTTLIAMTLSDSPASAENAKLMANAPLLLAALKACVADLERLAKGDRFGRKPDAGTIVRGKKALAAVAA